MKGILYFSVVALAYLPLDSHASCNDLIKQISEKIEAKGAPASQFKLEAVPNAQAEEAGGEIVGTCNGGTRKVIYTRQWHTAKTSETHPQTVSSENRQSNTDKAKKEIPSDSAAEPTTPEEAQPSAQTDSNNQTAPEESQPSVPSSTNEQTTPEESAPNTQSSSENLRSIEDRYKFLLEGSQSDT